MGDRLIVSPGGKGANQAVAAARLGAEVYMVGCIGDDDYGRIITDSLKESHVHTDYVFTRKGTTTGTAHITLAEGDNSIIVIKGANAEVGPEEVDRAWDMISTAEIVLLQYEIPMETIDYVVKKCAEAGVKVLLNPAPFADTPEEWMEKASYITPNEHEAKLMFPGMSRSEILSAHPDKLIMTIGGDGVAFAHEGEGEVVVPGFKVPVKDTTGAGDTFCLLYTSIHVGQGDFGQLETSAVPAGFCHCAGKLCRPVRAAAERRTDHGRKCGSVHSLD